MSFQSTRAMTATAVAHASPPGAPTYTISELAKEFDLTTRAIRFYEDCGLLAPQRSGRKRIYTARDRTRLKLTLRGKRLGPTRPGEKGLVDIYEPPRDTQPLREKFLDTLAGDGAQPKQQLVHL